MALKNIVIKNRYLDSVVLMQLSSRAAGLPGVKQASAMMGSGNNKTLLADAGLLAAGSEAAGADDIILAVETLNPEDLDAVLQAMTDLLSGADSRAQAASAYSPKTLSAGVTALQGANLVLISLPGIYVKPEALKALDLGCHLMIFSDNVPLEDELEIKRKGAQAGLLVMGPDCGTAIINGRALGFANRVKRGAIGIVGAAGTGIQEASVILSRMGAGISQAIGTGGRDLKSAIGGITMLTGMEYLSRDPATQVILIISKPPAPEVEERILARAAKISKPVVINFLGGDMHKAGASGLKAAATLEQGALEAAKLAGYAPLPDAAEQAWQAGLLQAAKRLAPEQKYLRGLFSGGTLCQEAQLILSATLAPLYSNIPQQPEWKLPDSKVSRGHTLVDLGEDEFTVGVPHPMIDYTLRCKRILAEARDPEVAVILLDVVLGYGSHPDPAQPLIAALNEVKSRNPGREIIWLASICGLPEDPQDYGRQRQALQAAGVFIAPSNAAAARGAAALLSALR